MLIKLPRTDNKPSIVIKSENIQTIDVFDLTFNIWFKDDPDYKITCPIHVLTHLESILDIVDLTKPQKDPF